LTQFDLKHLLLYNFGSEKDSYAGQRGVDIAKTLAKEICDYSNVEIWYNSSVIYVFKDKKVGVQKDGVYKLIIPKLIINATGAREKFLSFKGNTLTGIYGAGAFQTIVNRDLVKPMKKLLVIGGGNVGLITAYHALQANIEVVGLVEVAFKCGGYKVHADKIKRLGVTIYNSHTILSANGKTRVESVTICEVDSKFNIIEGRYKTIQCDTVLIAVGLNSINEFTKEAKKAGIPVVACGDAYQIAEASSAMFNGKIACYKALEKLGIKDKNLDNSLIKKAEILKSAGGKIKNYQEISSNGKKFVPVIHCLQEIPCNPCSTVCPENAIILDGDDILGVPKWTGVCIGCAKCLQICPGLTITLLLFY